MKKIKKTQKHWTVDTKQENCRHTVVDYKKKSRAFNGVQCKHKKSNMLSEGLFKYKNERILYPITEDLKAIFVFKSIKQKDHRIILRLKLQ